MRRGQLEHAIRTACQIIGRPEVIVVGSQSILGTFGEDELPADATMSVEIDGTWAYRMDLGPGSGEGRSQRQVAGFRSREEAEAALAEVLAARGGGDPKTVAGFLELVWLPGKRGQVDRSTFDQYAWAVRRHIVPALGQCKLAELQPAQLDRWLRRLGTAPRGDRGRPLSPTSVRLIRKVLSMACEDAAERGLLAENPVRCTEVPSPASFRDGRLDFGRGAAFPGRGGWPSVGPGVPFGGGRWAAAG